MLVHELAHANDDMPNTLAQVTTKGSEKVRVLFCRDFCHGSGAMVPRDSMGHGTGCSRNQCLW